MLWRLTTEAAKDAPMNVDIVGHADGIASEAGESHVMPRNNAAIHATEKSNG